MNEHRDESAVCTCNMLFIPLTDVIESSNLVCAGCQIWVVRLTCFFLVP